jgi:hypothetical protein
VYKRVGSVRKEKCGAGSEAELRTVKADAARRLGGTAAKKGFGGENNAEVAPLGADDSPEDDVSGGYEPKSRPLMVAPRESRRSHTGRGWSRI